MQDVAAEVVECSGLGMASFGEYLVLLIWYNDMKLIQSPPKNTPAGLDLWRPDWTHRKAVAIPVALERSAVL